VHNAMITEPKSFKESDIEEDIFKAYKMQGLVVADPSVASLMDTSLDSGRSDVVPMGLKKDGQFYSDSKIASEQSFNELRDYVHEFTVRSGIQMISESIELNPYDSKQIDACTLCSFNTVCQFGPALNTYSFKHLQYDADETIFE